MKRVHLIAFFAALLAGCATYFFAQTYTDSKTVDVINGEQTPVYIAKEDVPVGTKIDEETIATLFEKKNVATIYVVNGFVSDMNTVMGKLSTRTIYKGDQVSEHDFVEESNSTVGLSYTVEKDYVAISVSAGSIMGVDGYIRVGDTVNILAKYIKIDQETGEEIPNSETYEYAFEDLKVIKVATNQQVVEAGGAGNVASYGSITLEVPKDKAREIFEMEDKSGGGYKFVLNHRDPEVEDSDSTVK